MDEQNNSEELQFGGVTFGDNNVDKGTTNTAGTTRSAGLPTEVSIWSKVKAFLLQDVNNDLVVTMTPYQAKVLKEVHDFWFQEIDFLKVKDFLFQDITLGTKK